MLAMRLTKNRMMQATFICFVASLFFGYELMQLHMMNAISPMLMKDLSLNATDFGVLGSTYLMADVIFLLPAGMILDRFSVRRVILAALALCILGTFGFAYSTTLWQACACHFFSGIGNAFCFLSCVMLCSRWFPARWHALVMGLMVTMGLLGGVIAQTPFSLLAQAFTWRQALMIDACLGLAIFALIFLFVVDAREEGEMKGKTLPFWEGVRRSVFNRQNFAAGMYTGFMNLPVMILGAMWGSLFLTQVHGMGLVEASFITSMICMGTIVGSPLMGLISDKIQQRKPVMYVGAFASLIIFGLITLVRDPQPLMFTTLFFLLGLTTSTQVLGYPVITESNPPELTGTSMGVAAIMIMGSALVLQPISGYLIDMNWDGQLVNGARFYAYTDFLRSFVIFPIGFAISLLLTAMVREKKPVLSQA
ncbi:MAG: putative MFS-type transporter YcaD [Chlamydiia bacterium]|nr:putative MFS-type transporter YcaD [Chlamydiia bacterium]MCH9615781.1 putative MFS-type transporter YcaD [Chlamydiia bacterium]MCH9628816.1 putative MFS-type transporter YcaD [Chlamydiia bacterium]